MKMEKLITPLVLSSCILLSACDGNDSYNSTSTPAEDESPNIVLAAPTNDLLLNTNIKNNEAAYIPAQCYTKTQQDGDATVHNPCYACHNESTAPNYINDYSFQLAYEFRPYTRLNHWDNLFKDRTAEVNAISNEAMTQYIRTSNYFDANGDIILAKTLTQVPANWDFNQDGKWSGYTPDCYFNFDSEGFDKTPSGDDSGWKVFAYTPFLGTFWPTNGSTDDVLIRLPAVMQQMANGQYSRDVYNLNLSIVEAMIKRKNISIPATDENLYNTDLNRNGQLDIATEIIYQWQPTAGTYMYYVGKAKVLQEQGDLHIAAGLYPEGTEMLHSVRYIDTDEQGHIHLAPRMKELRYSYKHQWNTYSQINNVALSEIKESDQFPERLRTIRGNPETGLNNSLGWIYQGFIEDADGDLRPQSFEESLYCVGCHSGIGVTSDSSFAFPRKLDGANFQAGWFHWSQHGLQNIAEPKWSDGTWEYTEYLKQNHSGNEFRNNDEVMEKFFDSEGNLISGEVETLHNDISHLLLPSPTRAMQLNKAYKVIVNEQSYIYGRDAHIEPLVNVWDEVPEDEATGVTNLVISN